MKKDQLIRLPAQLQDSILKFTDHSTPEWERENLLIMLMDVRDVTSALIDGYEKAQAKKKK